jgi:hypothetical protein
MDSGHSNDGKSQRDGDHELLSLGAAIRAALDNGVDPYVVAGVLAEGAAYAIARHVRRGERAKAATILMLTLHERLKSYGVG